MRILFAVPFVVALAVSGCSDKDRQGNTGNPFGDPDLLARNITYQKTTLQPGESTRVSWDVSNQGDKTSGSFRVTVYASVDNVITTADFKVASIDQSPYGPGDSRNLSIDVTAPTTPGSYFTAAFADDKDEVSESREGNNISNILQIVVVGNGPADLIASNYIVNPTSINLGQAVNYTVSVINVGSTNAGSFRVGVYQSPTATVTTANTLVASQTIGSLNAGSNTTLNASFTPTAKGTFFYAIIVDDQNAVTESNDGNQTSNSVQVTVN
jgi:subtilase family serine protease